MGYVYLREGILPLFKMTVYIHLLSALVASGCTGFVTMITAPNQQQVVSSETSIPALLFFLRGCKV